MTPERALEEDKMHPIKTLTAGGLRGLTTSQEVKFAAPDGARTGSGLTILVGANNAGKSTFIDALRAFTSSRNPSFSEGKRNKAFGDQVRLRLETTVGDICEINSLTQGTSETEKTGEYSETLRRDLFVVPSRRTFSAYFNDPGMSYEREHYSNVPVPAQKSPVIDNFSGRLFKANRQGRTAFDEVLGRIVRPLPDWTIDQADGGTYFLKFRWGAARTTAHAHSSDGLGEGLISLFFIVDALYDSSPGDVICIDEPELSLHPQLQRRLRSVLSEFAIDRQIVYSTHSPYFVSWEDIKNGANIVRVHKSVKDGSVVSQPVRAELDKVAKMAADMNNPHVLGIEASEVFFLDDAVILTEGQEDVVFLRRIVDQLDIVSAGDFYGWGVGGAEKMGTITKLLRGLGYRRVVGVLDNDRLELRDELREEFPGYRFDCIDADDIRPKKAREITPKRGLVDEKGNLRPEHHDATASLIEGANKYLASDPDATM